MTHVTCRLTAKNRDQLRNPTLGNRVLATFLHIIIQNTELRCAYMTPPHRRGSNARCCRCMSHQCVACYHYRAMVTGSIGSRWCKCSEKVRYDTIRDAILTCTRKPTWVSLIYRTKTTTKKYKTEKIKVKTDMLRTNSKSLGNPCSQSRRRKGKAAVGRICRKGRYLNG